MPASIRSKCHEPIVSGSCASGAVGSLTIGRSTLEIRTSSMKPSQPMLPRRIAAEIQRRRWPAAPLTRDGRFFYQLAVDVKLRRVFVEGGGEVMPLVVDHVDTRADFGRREAGQKQAQIAAAGVGVQLPMLGRFLRVVGDQDIETLLAGQAGPAFDRQRPLVVKFFVAPPRLPVRADRARRRSVPRAPAWAARSRPQALWRRRRAAAARRPRPCRGGSVPSRPARGSIRPRGPIPSETRAPCHRHGRRPSARRAGSRSSGPSPALRSARRRLAAIQLVDRFE